MDEIFPEGRAILVQRSACVCSLLRGDVPYCRSLGLRADLDAAAPAEAQVLLGDAAYQVEQNVPGARVTSGRVSVTPDGRASVRLAVTEA